MKHSRNDLSQAHHHGYLLNNTIQFLFVQDADGGVFGTRLRQVPCLSIDNFGMVPRLVSEIEKILLFLRTCEEKVLMLIPTPSCREKPLFEARI